MDLEKWSAWEGWGRQFLLKWQQKLPVLHQQQLLIQAVDTISCKTFGLKEQGAISFHQFSLTDR